MSDMDKVSIYETIVNLSADFITLIDRGYRYVLANEAYCREVQKSRAQVVDRTVAEVWGEEKFHAPIKGFLDRCFPGEEVNNIDKFKFGPFMKYMHVTYFPYRDDGGRVTHVLVFSHDITHIGEIESKLTNYEYRDPVTGLFNRRSLGVILEKEIEKAKLSERREPRAVLVMGLHDMDAVRQLHGYEISDLLLENTGIRFRKALRPNDYVFRFDGNELAAVLTDIPDKADLASLASSVLAEVTTPYRFHDMDITLTCSLGISLYPDDGEDADVVTRNSLTAMMEARRRGEPFLIFDAELHETANRQPAPPGRAFQRIPRQRAFPRIPAHGHTGGAHRRRGGAYPLASPYARRAAAHGVHTACNAFRSDRQDRTLGGLQRVRAGQALDGHARHVRVHQPFRKRVPGPAPRGQPHAGNERAGDLPPDRIRLEITETESMMDPEATINRMLDLRNIGVEVFIDDFGTGHSSLSYLKELPATTLKIDKSFIQHVDAQEEEHRFIRSLVEIIKVRKKMVIVEGVSSPRRPASRALCPATFSRVTCSAPPCRAQDFEKLLTQDDGAMKLHAL